MLKFLAGYVAAILTVALVWVLRSEEPYANVDYSAQGIETESEAAHERKAPNSEDGIPTTASERRDLISSNRAYSERDAEDKQSKSPFAISGPNDQIDDADNELDIQEATDIDEAQRVAASYEHTESADDINFEATNDNIYGIPDLQPSLSPIPIGGQNDRYTQLLDKTGSAQASWNPDFNTLDLVKKHRTLENESKDPDWAYLVEKEFINFLINSNQFRNFFTFGLIECRTTLCEYQFYATDPERAPGTRYKKQLRRIWTEISKEMSKQPWWAPVLGEGHNLIFRTHSDARGTHYRMLGVYKMRHIQ